MNEVLLHFLPLSSAFTFLPFVAPKQGCFEKYNLTKQTIAVSPEL